MKKKLFQSIVAMLFVFMMVFSCIPSYALMSAVENEKSLFTVSSQLDSANTEVEVLNELSEKQTVVDSVYKPPIILMEGTLTSDSLIVLEIPRNREYILNAEKEGFDTQWQLSRNNGSSWENIHGALGQTYTVAATKDTDNYLYRCLLNIEKQQYSKVWQIKVIDIFSGGVGTEKDPYVIKNCFDLEFLAEQVNGGYSFKNQYFLQTADIDLQGEPWIPIGVREKKWLDSSSVCWDAYNAKRHPFSGYYDGDNHKIENLVINRETKTVFNQDIPDAGLFGYIEGDTAGDYCPVIQNLHIISPKIDSLYRAGSLVGTGYHCDIINCSATDVDITGVTGVGGLAGELFNRNLIGCYATGKIFATEEVYSDDIMRYYVPVLNRYENDPDKWYSKAGGLVGSLTNMTDYNVANEENLMKGAKFSTLVEDCFANVDITAYGHNVGGFTGIAVHGTKFRSFWDFAIRNCYAGGNITICDSNQIQKASWIGGFAGSMGAVKLEICFAGSPIYGFREVGGFYGLFDTIEGSYAKNIVSLSPVVIGTKISDKIGSFASRVGNVGRVYGKILGELDGLYAYDETKLYTNAQLNQPIEYNKEQEVFQDGISLTQVQLQEKQAWINAGFDFSSAGLWGWNEHIKMPYLKRFYDVGQKTVWTNDADFRLQPTDQSCMTGNSVTFGAWIVGSDYKLQWQQSTDGSEWNDITNATSLYYKIDSVAEEVNGNKFRCVATITGKDPICSEEAILHVLNSSFVEQPVNYTTYAQGKAVFSIKADGNGLTYQWQKSTDNGDSWVDIVGATETSYTYDDVLISDNGALFRCVVSANGKDIVSSSGKLTVLAQKITIASQEDLLAMAELVKVADDTSAMLVKQTADIDLNDVEWVPIGTGDKPFAGSYDGQNYKIMNLTYSGNKIREVALFGGTKNALLENIQMSNVQIENLSTKLPGGSIVNPYPSTAALVATAINTTIRGCSANGGSLTNTTANKSTYMGGLVANVKYDSKLEDNFDIEKCWTNLKIYSSGSCTGGLIGGMNLNSSYVANMISMKDCFTAGDILFRQPTGSGVNAFVVRNCCGGLYGDFWGDVENCYVTGNVDNAITGICIAYYVGGLGGKAPEHNVKIKNNIVASGKVVGCARDSYGRIISKLDNITIEGAYCWDATELYEKTINKSPVNADRLKNSIQGEDLTAAQLQSKETWVNLGFDFDTTWEWDTTTDSGSPFPKLKNVGTVTESPLKFGVEIIAHPVDIKTGNNGNATFTIEAVGNGLSYQWQRKASGQEIWENIPTATAVTYTIVGATHAANNGDLYRCIITNSLGQIVESNFAKLTVTEGGLPAEILVQPVNAQVMLGDFATFNLVASGDGNLNYKWQINIGNEWKDIEGVDSAACTTAEVVTEITKDYKYRCVVSNDTGTVTSGEAGITIIDSYDIAPLTDLTINRATNWRAWTTSLDFKKNKSLKKGEGVLDISSKRIYETVVFHTDEITLTPVAETGWNIVLNGTKIYSDKVSLPIKLNKGDNFISVQLTNRADKSNVVNYIVNVKYVPELALIHMDTSKNAVIALAYNKGEYIYNFMTDPFAAKAIFVLADAYAETVDLKIQTNGGNVTYKRKPYEANQDGIVTIPLTNLPDNATSLFPGNSSVSLGTLTITHPDAGDFSNIYRIGFARKPEFAANRVYEISPAPGQFVNCSGWGINWNNTLSLTGSGVDLTTTATGPGISLGAWGGNITFQFDEPIKNNPKHLYGMDFKVFGNNFGGSFEPGGMMVAQDKNKDSVPDEWYYIAGSMHYNYNTVWDYEKTYINTEPNLETLNFVPIPWVDNKGNESTFIGCCGKCWNMFPAVSIYGQAVYDGTMEYQGKELPVYKADGFVVGKDVSLTKGSTDSALFGYADAEPNPSLPKYGGDPSAIAYYSAYENNYKKNAASGTNVDISWAVDKDGKPICLDEISFVKVFTAMDATHAAFGENSTEITGISRITTQANSKVGVTEDLEALKINGKDILEEADQTIGNTKYYDINLNNSSLATVQIEAKGANSDNIIVNDTCFADGVADFTTLLKSDGSRTVRVIVQNGEKEAQIYVIHCSGGGNPVINADLATVILTPGDVVGTLSNGVYTFDVANNVEKVSLKLDALNPYSTITVNGEKVTSGTAMDPFMIQVGENTYQVKVTSNDGTKTREYTVKIDRKASSSSQIEQYIKVMFSLTGDTLHGEGGKHAPETWIDRQTVEVPKDSTVKYVTDLILYNADIEFDNTDGTYIAKIKSPFTGKWLGEFDNGPNSGWMYRHNKKIADVGYANRVLKNGDKVEWFYTDDYTKETGYEGDWDKINSDSRSDTKMLTKTLSNGKVTIKSAELKGVTLLNIIGDVNLILDSNALKDIGILSDITNTVNKLEKPKLDNASKKLIGNRPVYEITITVGGKEVTKLSSGKITIAIPYTPAKEENAAKLFGYYIDSNGRAKKVSGSKYDSTKKAVIIVTNHLSKYAIGYDESDVVHSSFSDVPADHWANEYITYLFEKGIITGRTDTAFAPDDNITRAELVAILARMKGDVMSTSDSNFNDVKANAWYAKNIAWAVKAGITKGRTDKIFAPNDKITRQEMAVMISRYAEYEQYELPKINTVAVFADQEKIANYAKESVVAMQQAGIIEGRGNNLFVPNGNATRAETAKMLTILMQGMEK